jgi:alkylhydroperoxidase family enzyme
MKPPASPSPVAPGEDVETADARVDALHEDFYARVDAAGLDEQDPTGWPEELRAELEATWEIIFAPSRYGRAAYWQATLHGLRAEDVVEAVRFTN